LIAQLFKQVSSIDSPLLRAQLQGIDAGFEVPSTDWASVTLLERVLIPIVIARSMLTEKVHCSRISVLEALSDVSQLSLVPIFGIFHRARGSIIATAAERIWIVGRIRVVRNVSVVATTTIVVELEVVLLTI
jgi:hypothetical protein